MASTSAGRLSLFSLASHRVGQTTMLAAAPEPQRSPKSTFKNALKSIPVPPELIEGVDVLRVYANGKTKRSFLTLSDDKFTLYVTTDKYKKSAHKGFFRRRQDKDERAIDIGAIDRIQRGHATHKFVLARYVATLC